MRHHHVSEFMTQSAPYSIDRLLNFTRGFTTPAEGGVFDLAYKKQLLLVFYKTTQLGLNFQTFLGEGPCLLEDAKKPGLRPPMS